jgi:hypothetical protein
MLSPAGLGEVYVRAYPGGGALRKVSTDAGNQPRWSRNGEEIVYVDLDARVRAVDVSREGDALALGVPRRLFDLPVAQMLDGTFDASADGNRFVVLLEPGQQNEPERRTHVTMVFNFLEDLRRATAGAAE